MKFCQIANTLKGDAQRIGLGEELAFEKRQSELLPSKNIKVHCLFFGSIYNVKPEQKIINELMLKLRNVSQFFAKPFVGGSIICHYA